MISRPVLLLLLGIVFSARAADPFLMPENPGGGTGRTFYVNGSTGNDTNTGLAADSAWRTIQKAADTMVAGDTVLIMDHGSPYHERRWNQEWKNWEISRSGSAGQYITYRNYPGHKPRLLVDTWNGLEVANASYIEIDGLNIEGLPDPASITGDPENSADRLALASDPRYFGNGISVFGSGSWHHVRIRNCTVQSVGGNGIGASGGTLLLVQGNRVWNVSHRSRAANSAISVIDMDDRGAAPSGGYGIVIRDNTCHDAVNMLDYQYYPQITDGNGIILDTLDASRGGAGYAHRTAVVNNLVFNNGGRGIHAYQSSRADIINNTAWQNLRSPDLQAYEGELSAVTATDVVFRNNIAAARSGVRAYNIPTAAAPAFVSNIVLSSRVDQTAVDSSNKTAAAPLFVNASTDYSVADFRLASGSPAIDAGASGGPETDMAGVARPQGSAPDIGAHEFVAAVPVPPAITSHPVPVTVLSGANATFSVVASGSAPLAYQWKKDGGNLTDGGPVSGSKSDTLTITGTAATDAGSYSVDVTNSAGSATSIAATLTVSQSVTAFSDDFSDNDRTASPAWFTVSGASSNLATTQSGGILSLTRSTTGAANVCLAAGWAGTTLATTGDSLTLEFRAKVTGITANKSSAFNFGVGTSNGTAATADNQNVYVNDKGYSALLGFGTHSTSSNTTIVADSGTDRWIGSQLSTDAIVLATKPGNTNSLSLTAAFQNYTMVLTRNAAGGLDIVLGNGNGSLVVTHATPVTLTFNQVLLGFYCGGSTESLDVDSLSVTFSAATTFASWIADPARNVPAGQQGAGADPDGDGLSNLLEYALGLDPVAATASNRPAVGTVNVSGSDFLAITFRRLKNGTGAAADGYTAGGVTYTVQVSTDLATWNTGSANLVQIGSPTDNGDGTENVTLRASASLAVAPKQFLRLQTHIAP